MKPNRYYTIFIPKNATVWFILFKIPLAEHYGILVDGGEPINTKVPGTPMFSFASGMAVLVATDLANKATGTQRLLRKIYEI